MLVNFCAASLARASRPAHLSRGIFNLFRKSRGEKTDLPSTFHNKTSQDETKDDYKTFAKEREEEARFLKKRDEFLKVMTQKRESYDKQLMERRRQADEASTAARREYEITLGNLDYGKIIQENVKFNIESEFEDVEQLALYLSQISFARVKLTEENMVKVIRGHLKLADQIGSNILEGRDFADFLDMVRARIEAFKDIVETDLSGKSYRYNSTS